jgi:hypothetical protein
MAPSIVAADVSSQQACGLSVGLWAAAEPVINKAAAAISIIFMRILLSSCGFGSATLPITNFHVSGSAASILLKKRQKFFVDHVRVGSAQAVRCTRDDL